MKKLIFLNILICSLSIQAQENQRPNILFCIADDWGRDAPVYGNRFISIPNFDKVAESGVYFTNAYVAAPTCTASRAGILTGRCPSSLEKGANLFGTLDAKYDVYPDLLENDGYQVAFTGKGWGPGSIEKSGRTRNPAGDAYNDEKLDSPSGISDIDYSGNFKAFMNTRDKSKPFCFWYGAHEPHRSYQKGIGKDIGKINVCDIEVPGFYPDRIEIKEDLADYYYEVNWFDKHLGEIIEYLKEAGEYENTIIVVTGDHGMPFPRGKGGLYEAGIHAPLAIAWPKGIKFTGREISDFVSLRDMFATFLDVAGISVPKEAASKSIIPLLLSEKSGRIDSTRNHVYAMRERHASSREDNVGYPVRAIVTDTFLYLRNSEPKRSPHGDLLLGSNHDGPLADTDAGPTKFWLLEYRNDPIYSYYFNLSFATRPEEELYMIKKDPFQLHNLAGMGKYEVVLEGFREQLKESMKEHDDPRYTNKNILFDIYKPPFSSPITISPKDLEKWYYSNMYPKK
jgi:uncharacterized sulfatase